MKPTLMERLAQTSKEVQAAQAEQLEGCLRRCSDEIIAALEDAAKCGLNPLIVNVKGLHHTSLLAINETKLRALLTRLKEQEGLEVQASLKDYCLVLSVALPL